MDRLGFVILMIGASMADSDSLLIPFVMVSLGACLLWRGTHVR